MKRLLGLIAGLGVTLTAAAALAQEGATGGILARGDGGMIAVAVALGIGMAALGGALGQGRTASAALEGIARNPNAADKIFTPMILGLALIESLVIYGLVIAFMLQAKI